MQARAPVPGACSGRGGEGRKETNWVLQPIGNMGAQYQPSSSFSFSCSFFSLSLPPHRKAPSPSFYRISSPLSPPLPSSTSPRLSPLPWSSLQPSSLSSPPLLSSPLLPKTIIVLHLLPSLSPTPPYTSESAILSPLPPPAIRHNPHLPRLIQLYQIRKQTGQHNTENMLGLSQFLRPTAGIATGLLVSALASMALLSSTIQQADAASSAFGQSKSTFPLPSSFLPHKGER